MLRIIKDHVIQTIKKTMFVLWMSIAAAAFIVLMWQSYVTIERLYEVGTILKPIAMNVQIEMEKRKRLAEQQKEDKAKTE